MLLDSNSVDSRFEMPASRTKIKVPEVESCHSRDRQNHRRPRILIRRDLRREGFRDYPAGSVGSLTFDAIAREAAGVGRFPAPPIRAEGAAGALGLPD